MLAIRKSRPFLSALIVSSVLVWFLFSGPAVFLGLGGVAVAIVLLSFFDLISTAVILSAYLVGAGFLFRPLDAAGAAIIMIVAAVVGALILWRRANRNREDIRSYYDRFGF